MRERIELRSKASLTQHLLNAVRGRAHGGAEAELNAAARISPDGMPLELRDTPQPGAEKRDITPAPGTVGVNLDSIRPAVFANAVPLRLGVEMPRVMSGTYASVTITTCQTAGAKTKSAAATATAGALTVTTAAPKRISPTGGEGGIRTHVPGSSPDKALSRRPRYGHFGTSPGLVGLGALGVGRRRPPATSGRGRTSAAARVPRRPGLPKTP